MLKFTKYGRTASTGNLPINSHSQRKDKPPVVLTSFKGVSTLSTVSTSTNVSGERSNESNANVGDGSGKPTLTIGSKTHLQRSKVSKEELIKLDSKFNELTGKKSEVTTNQCYHSNKFDSVDGDQICKKNRNCISSLQSGGSIRGVVSVYNDGYFPKVQPKYFTLKRSDSEFLSRKAPVSAMTHG